MSKHTVDINQLRNETLGDYAKELGLSYSEAEAALKRAALLKKEEARVEEKLNKDENQLELPNA